jgi:hypothetical protein
MCTCNIAGRWGGKRASHASHVLWQSIMTEPGGMLSTSSAIEPDLDMGCGFLKGSGLRV